MWELRSELAGELTAFIKRQELTQVQAAQLLGVAQPRISALINGKIELLGLDTLVTMAVHAGLNVEIQVKVPKKARSPVNG